MRKSIYGLLIGAGLGAALALPFLVIVIWHWFVHWPQLSTTHDWPDWLTGALATCLLLGLRLPARCGRPDG